MTEATKKVHPRLEYPWTDLIKKEPWRADDKKKWDERETLRLAQTSKALSPRDKQELFAHQLHLEAHPCWLCGERNTWYFAHGRCDSDYEGRKFHCVRCEVELRKVVPVLDLRNWYWGKPEEVSPALVIHHAEIWQEKEMHP